MSFMKDFNHLQIQMKDIVSATNNFDPINVIGRGGFGRVYKGELSSPEGQITVAFKQLDRRLGQGNVEFWKEIMMLSKYKHENLISLKHFCIDGDDMILVYEYASRGSLDQYLGDASTLTWSQRLKICIGAARGLLFLHDPKETQHRVLHRDVKSANILLDENWSAKVSDFGLSKLSPANQAHTSYMVSNVVGTYGYCDPEFMEHGFLSKESDVYSFGVVLFEILCGKLCYEYCNGVLAKILVPEWKQRYDERRLDEIILSDLREQMDPGSLKTFSAIAYQCVKKAREERPMMAKVVEELKYAALEQLGNLRIRLADIQLATDNFSETYKAGGTDYFASYRVGLDLFQRHNPVIIQRFHPIDDEQGKQMFFTELDMLTSVKHRGIVTLLGFCVEGPEMILVLENFVSLSYYLQNVNYDKSRILTWEKRLKICIDIAYTLNYLHYEMKDQKMIILRDLRSTNIALNYLHYEMKEQKMNWKAKIDLCGSSVLLPLNQEDDSFCLNKITQRDYTRYYIDPEYEKTDKLKRESNVYSFGIVLLEILCGREANDPIYLKESDKGLAPVARRRFCAGTLADMLDPIIKEELDENSCVLNEGPNKDSLKTFIEIAFQCVTETRHQRPTMKIVLKELEKASFFQKFKHLKISPAVIKLATDNFSELKISLAVIKLATDNFSETYKIGGSLYYSYYRARLDLFQRHNTVIVWRFHRTHDKKREQVFFTELDIFTSVKHRGIVTLLGFCVEGPEMIFVTEDAYYGSLSIYLGNENYDKRRILTWEKRLKICIDVAHALNYLHSGMEDQKMIILLDIDAGSIWLDANWGAKMALNQDGDSVCASSFTQTSSRYFINPEYLKTKRESDVYSFGVVLLQILCGRKTNDPIYRKESDKGLAPVARRRFCEGKLEDMIDPIMKEETKENIFFLKSIGPNNDSLQTFIEIALQCVAETQDQRPTMKIVVNELEKALFYQESSTENSRIPLKKALAFRGLENFEIRLSDIKLATSNFSEAHKIASRDGYTLYRAELEHFDKENPSSLQGGNKGQHPKKRSTVVIKRYPKGHKLYNEEKYLTEIEMLRCVKHPNIVALLGFCVEGSEMILITENVCNGYLFDYLGNDTSCILTWEKRLKICIDAAHALDYLHYEMEDQRVIIHRDIYCCSIGLGENRGAKIVDFWWSVFLPPNQEDEALYLKSTGILQYTDPEYINTRKLKRESDVYSFGVVLFEILSGRLAYDPIYMKETDKGLAAVARRSFHTGTIEDIVDPMLKDETGKPNKQSLNTFIEIAHQCVAETQDERPTMKVVVKELEKALSFQEMKDYSRIPLGDIRLATQNFNDDNCIGGEGFWKVYKGSLQDVDGHNTIVAKRLDTRIGQGGKQFFSELQILREFKHENVIGLVGYCDEEDEKIIVYEYASKGSLDKYLNKASLTWMKRLNICIDVARALDFIHGGVGKQAKVIHRDIKTASILLNDEWKAKLADFELFLIIPISQETEYVIDHACGTAGYIDPLFIKSGFLTIESDIYSFGVVLFELLCGRSTFAIHEHEGHYLQDFIKNRFEEGKHDEVVFEQIMDQIEPRSLTTFQNIAYQCLHHEREKRPTAKEVLMQLKKALEYQLNPLDQTDGSADSVYCWPCGFWMRRFLGQRS